MMQHRCLNFGLLVLFGYLIVSAGCAIRIFPETPPCQPGMQCANDPADGGGRESSPEQVGEQVKEQFVSFETTDDAGTNDTLPEPTSQEPISQEPASREPVRSERQQEPIRESVTLPDRPTLPERVSESTNAPDLTVEKPPESSVDSPGVSGGVKAYEVCTFDKFCAQGLTCIEFTSRTGVGVCLRTVKVCGRSVCGVGELCLRYFNIEFCTKPCGSTRDCPGASICRQVSNLSGGGRKICS